MSKAFETVWSLSLWMPDGWKNQYGYKSKYGPGQIVEKCLGEERRAALKELKSDELANIRPDLVYVYDERQRRKDEFSQLKLDFDRQMLGIQR